MFLFTAWSRLTNWLWRVRKVSFPLIILTILTGLYVLAFIPVKPVVFGWSGSNCIDQLVVVPKWQKITGSSRFAMTYAKEVKLGKYRLAARQICVQANDPPVAGKYSLNISPMGGLVARQTVVIKVGKPPAIDRASLSTPIPLTKPLLLQLNQSDAIFNYRLLINQHQVDCINKQQRVLCDLSDLSLEQGKTYAAQIDRMFGQKVVETIIEPEIKILPAVMVTETSIQPDQTIYDRPTRLTFKMDKPLTAIKSSLMVGEDIIDSQATVVDGGAEVAFAELPRRQSFKLQLTAEAIDGSQLMAYSLAFTTSDGPVVSRMTIGHAAVALGSTAVLYFDQPLSPDQDVAGLVSISSGGRHIERVGNTVAIRLTDLGRCVPFTITIAAGLVNQYNVASDQAWHYNSRMTCKTVATIGTSVQGRPITAYTLGGGGAAILYIGAIHGDEVSAKRLLERWMAELEAAPDRIPAGRTVVVVPLANPDGYAAGSRLNAHGVDINRNFLVSDWQSDVTDTANNPLPGGGGSAAMSEPETQALANLTNRLKPRLTLSYHSIGGLVLGNLAADSASLAAKYSQLSGYRNTTGQSSTTFGYQITGTYDDWVAEKLSLPTLLIELGSHTDAQWSRNATALWSLLSS